MYIQEAITVPKLQLASSTVRQFSKVPLSLTNADRLTMRAILNHKTIAQCKSRLHRLLRLKTVEQPYRLRSTVADRSKNQTHSKPEGMVCLVCERFS